MTPNASTHRRFVQILRETVAAPESDAALLARFIDKRDEAAFATIVERHGSLVVGVSRRMLGDSADADDAFQAVFLALVRNARRIRKGDSLAAWLYGAAYRVCQKVRRSRSRSRSLERKVARRNSTDPLTEISVREFLALLDDELARLPERLRLPLVLCLIGGLSHNEAAERLGCSPGSIKGRLERGREKLRRRLVARGVTLAAALSASAVGSTNAAVSPDLFARAIGVASGNAVPEAVAKLAAAAVRSSTSALRISAVVLLGVATSIAAAMGGSQQTEPKPAADQPDKPAKATAHVDRFGDPLPEGALMRLGTVQFRVPYMIEVGLRPNGELVAVDERLKMHVWPPDGKSPPKVTSIAGDKRSSGWFAVSPDARFVTTQVANNKVTVWDISGGNPVEYLSGELQNCYKFQFSDKGEWLVVNDRSPQGKGRLWLCDIKAKTWAELPFDGMYVESLSFSANGRMLVVTDGRGVSLIETATRKEKCHIGFPRPRIASAAVSPDEKTLAVQPMTFIHGPEPKVRFMSIPSGEEIAFLKPPPGMARWIKFSNDGKTIFRGDQHGIQQWDPVAGKIVREIPGPATSPLIFSGDGRRLASHGDNAVVFWDVAKGHAVRPDLENAGHTQRVSGIAISPDGKLIATNAMYGEIRVWSADTGRLLYRVKSSPSGEESIAFLPNSKSFIALADDFVTPTEFDAATGQELRRFAVPAEMATKERIRELRLSGDGKTLSTKSDTVIVSNKSYDVRWDVATGKPLERVEQLSQARIPGLDPFGQSPDGRWRFEAGNVNRVGTNESAQLIPTFECPYGTSRFSADSRIVAMPRTPRAGQKIDINRSSMAVFELDSMSKIAEFPIGRTIGYGSAFSPDGRRLAVSSPEHITVWDLATSKPVRRFAPPAQTQTIAFTPDSRRMITGHNDSTAIVWDLSDTRRTDGKTLSADELTRLWNSLAGDDVAKAFAATFELSDHPKPTIEFLRRQLKPSQAANAERVRKLAGSLDAKSFAEREKAEKELRVLGELAVPHLQAALKDNPSPEKKTRIDRLLAEAAKFLLPPGERLRQVRAIAVLEHIGTDDARRLLKELAGGLPEARQTREAAEALGRLNRSQLGSR